MEKQPSTERVSLFPTTRSSSPATCVRGHRTLRSGSTFLARGCKGVSMGSLGTQFIKQIPLPFGHVSGQDLFLGP